MTAPLSPKWFPDHIDGIIAPLAQAKLYPYPAPEGDFWMRGGLPELRPDGIHPDELRGRTPVISVGSNRAPLQLRRKFGLTAELPVTACILHDCDITYAATLSFYCASPATACPSPGTSVTLNITWLDPDQLANMHETEALGVAYDFVRLNDGLVDHGDRPDHAVFQQPIYGYQSRSGLLQFSGQPIAHQAIPATGRIFDAMNEAEVLAAINARTCGADQNILPLDHWLDAMREDRQLRLDVMEKLDAYSMPISTRSAPWEVMPIKAKNPDDFL